jgi:hypothetical protein
MEMRVALRTMLDRIDWEAAREAEELPHLAGRGARIVRTR